MPANVAPSHPDSATMNKEPSMPQKPQPQPRWLPASEEHNFPAAESCLSLIYPAVAAAKLALELRTAAAAQFKAKDIFRASQLSLLG
jgi:hypothetical protein